MIEGSVRHGAEMVECPRHEGHDCPRCGGSGYRLRRVCAGCGERAKYLTAARSAPTPEEASKLPLYCPKCNSRRRNAGAVIAGLERTGA